MTEVLVTGGTGLVASRFLELSKSKFELSSPHYPDFDLTKIESIEKVIDEFKPEVIVNFAAYTNVSEGENQRGDEKGVCWRVNVGGVGNLLRAIKDRNIRLIQISTDMVFSGSEEDKGPYDEEHDREKDPDKLTWYGFTKGQGERLVEEVLQEKATIVRIIYPVRAKFSGKLDYLRGPLAKFDGGELKAMFSDQQICITFIDELALVLEKIVNENMYGIFHLASEDTITPYDLISYLLEKSRGIENVIHKSSLGELIKNGTIKRYRYPMFGGLKVTKTEEALGLKFRTTREIVDELVRQGI